MAAIVCDECDAVIPARLTNKAERDGFVIVAALCPECSPTGNYDLKFEVPDPSTRGDSEE
jgi:hypothetical protein